MRNHYYRKENLLFKQPGRTAIQRVSATFSIALFMLFSLAAMVAAQIVEQQPKNWSDLASASRPQEIDAVLAAPGTMYAVTEDHASDHFQCRNTGNGLERCCDHGTRRRRDHCWDRRQAIDR
ncbi:MAG: hypothetical protein QM785_19485 [Pyrinomonadaceae bacterium]